MKKKPEILLLYGGDGTEHKISAMSAKFLEETFCKLDIKFNTLELTGNYYHSLTKHLKDNLNNISFIIPCIHGTPGETGEIQPVFELAGIPYLGSGGSESQICFNKVSSKLYFNQLDIPNTPFIFINNTNESELKKATIFFNQFGEVFVKASSQGSSIGCFKVTKESDLKTSINKALKLSPYVLIEKNIIGRELEVAVFEYKGDVKATYPGEIIPPSNNFYSFEEKYNVSRSTTTTNIKAPNLPENISNEIINYAIKAFKYLHLKDLSRIDFFLTNNNEIYLNEINTFPGMTPISMFPQMLEASNIYFKDFIKDRYTSRLK